VLVSREKPLTEILVDFKSISKAKIRILKDKRSSMFMEKVRQTELQKCG
jgi:hypothetical protein